MSLLAQQLGQLHAQSAVKIAPGAPKPTFILDQNTARNTTIDVLFTMALMGYKEIKKDLAAGAKELGEVLLSEEYKDLNRNKLSQPENKDLSVKLTRFLLLLSPWFLNRGCQSIIEYLLRNFHVHVFEAEQLVVLYLQYWQHQAYSKLLANVEVKKPHLAFIKEIQEGKSINLTYIVKSLTYSRSLLETLIMFTKRYIREESQVSQEVDIQILISNPTGCNLPTEISSLVKHDPKQFLLQILGELLQRKITSFNKEICELCVSTSREEDPQVRSMSMMLTISMLSSQPTHNLWVNRVLTNLLKCDEVDSHFFNFLMVVWQRWPKLLTNPIIQQLLEKQGLINLITHFPKSIYMPFLMLFKCYFQPGFPHKGILSQILQTCALKVKEESFVKAHYDVYYNQILTIFHQAVEKLDKQESKFIKAFVKKNLQHEYACLIDSQKYQPLTGILPEGSYKDGVVDFSKINLVRMEVQPEEQHPMQEETVSDEEEQFDQQAVEPQDTLLKIINSFSKREYQAIDVSNAEISRIALTLVEEYYKGDRKISSSQKNRLYEYPTIFTTYSVDKLNEDLNDHDYATAMRYVIKEQNIDLFYNVLTRMASDSQAANDLLFREFCRQVIQNLCVLAKDRYQAVVNMTSKLYSVYIKNKSPEAVRQLNETMLRLSDGVVKNGKSQGKFHKLISWHAKMLANLVLSQAHRDEYALATYNRILQIFKHQNSYFVLVGVIEILALKEKHNKEFGSFVDRVLLPSLKTEDQPYITYYHFLQALSKLLVFTYHMLNEGSEQSSIDEIINDMSYGVAKKLITNFFGLVSPKSKRNISRKIFLFLAVLFKSPQHSSIFENMLASITRKQELKVAAICSKIYSVLNTIFGMANGPLKQAADNAKTRLMQLFPLELKIYVLGPLLPLDEVYKELGNELASHSHKNFQSLAHFVNIQPTSLSSNWLKFATEAMKRGYIPTNQFVKNILSGEIDKASDSQLEFICVFTEYGKEQSLEVLEQVMEVALRQCNEPNEFSLAVIYTLVKNLKEYLQPYLDQMFKVAIEVETEKTKEFLQGITQLLTAPALLELIKNNWKTVQNLKNFTYFLNKVSKIVTFQSIWKVNQNFNGRCLNILVQSQESYEQLNVEQAEVFVNLALKMNDNQLRKVLIDYVRWASEKTNSDSAARLIFNSRKNVLINIFEGLSKKLGDLFTHFYGYIFETITKDLEDMQVHKESQSTKLVGGKRERGTSDYSLHCSIVYARSLTRGLMGLFSNDPANQFMDSVKFDLIGPKVGNLFNVTGFGNSYGQFVNDFLRPCLICLYVHTKDDYKLKSLNTEILRLLKTKDQRIAAAIYGFFEQVIDQIEHRFLLFTDELIPLLIEASNSRNPAIKKSVENIIYKVQNLSGQKIETYIR